jgi:hypothetical protein
MLPIISSESILGYFPCNVLTTLIAGSSASFTEKIIWKRDVGYVWTNADSRVVKRFGSRPFRGRSMDTPGSGDGGGGDGLGREEGVRLRLEGMSKLDRYTKSWKEHTLLVSPESSTQTTQRDTNRTKLSRREVRGTPKERMP